MALIEIQLRMPLERLDAWSDAVLAAGAVSVAIEDEDNATPEERARYGEPGLAPADPGWRNNRVLILFEESADLSAVLEATSHSLGLGTPAILARRRLDDCDWVRQTQMQFAPVRVGRIWIVPSWHEPPDPDGCNVRIDPGVAFGTGTHPSTRLCLAWLDQQLAPHSRVLDYGCGSGILSICAAKLGAAEVVGVDIDPQAVHTARANAERNGVRAQYTCPDGLVADGARRFDVVMANILASPIMLLAPTLLSHLRPAGSIVLSGILERQVEAVMAAYRRADPGLQLRIFGEQEGWVAIAGARES